MAGKRPGRPLDEEEPLDEPDEDENEFSDGFQEVDPLGLLFDLDDEDDLDDRCLDTYAGDDDDTPGYFD